MKRTLLILVALLLAAFVINLDTTIVDGAAPSLTKEPLPLAATSSTGDSATGWVA